MSISVYSATSKGKYHEKNEDSFFVGNKFIIVADGMGGKNDGDIASKLAVDTISGYLDTRLPDLHTCEELETLMVGAIRLADDEIMKFTADNPESRGMGTTVLIMAYMHNSVSLAWCGDSRCYLCRNGEIRSLTKDHSYVQELIDSNEITVDESFSHPDNNLITRYVGGGMLVCEPESCTYAVDGNDILILCSDGLSGYCREAEVEREMAAGRRLSSLPRRLTRLALSSGSEDDITIVAVAYNQRKTLFPTIGRWLCGKSYYALKK